MRLLAVSHACAVAMNQWLYVYLDRPGEMEVDLVAPRCWRGHLRRDLPFERLPELTCPVHPLSTTCAGEDLRMHLALYRGAGRLVRRLRPDMIYLDEEPYSLAAFQFAALARQVGARCVFYTMQNVLKPLPAPFRLLERQVFRWSHGATALTREAASVLRARGFRGPTAIVPLAVEMDRFKPQPRVGGEATVAPRHASPLPELGLQPPVIGYIGRLVRFKAVELLLEAFRILESEGVPFTGLIVGGGPEERGLRDQIRSLGLEPRVRMLPAAPHAAVARYYNVLDVAVVPSRTLPGQKEQFGRVLIEAMACGVPVIGSDSGAIPEVIAATGGGLTFPEGDPVALAAALRRLLHDPALRHRLAETGREGVGRHYSYQAVAATLREALLSFHRSPVGTPTPFY